MAAPATCRLACALCLGVWVAGTGCGGSGGDGGGGGIAPTKDAVQLDAWPAALDLEVGATVSARIRIVRGDGARDAVTLSASEVPAGVIADVTPTTTTGDTVALSLTLPAGAAPGLYAIRIAGTARERADASLSMPVSVQTGPFAMRAEPAAFDLRPGGPAARGTITIVRTPGFVWDVLPQVTSYPATVFAGTTPTADRDSWDLVVDPGRATGAMAFTLVIQGSTAIGAPPGSAGTLLVPVRLTTPP